MRRLLFALPLFAACEGSLPFYIAKQGFRHGALLLKAESVDSLLKQPNLDPKTERYLKLSKEIITYAEANGMKTRANYRKYIALDRDWVTQIVMAAKKDSLTPHLFSYPIVGDLPYRGFYDEQDSIEFEKKLAAQDLDTYRREVDAFSTTGWLPDPLVSSMFSDEARFIELLFHELTHATFYFASEADFNEAFASWMGFRLAVSFIEEHLQNDPNRLKLLGELKAEDKRQRELAAAVREILTKGHELYKRPNALEAREAYFTWVHDYLVGKKLLRAGSTTKWNNAVILGLSTYYELVGPIEAYAQKEKLAPKDLLRRVVERGPAIIREITAP